MIVELLGAPGVGKTTLARTLSEYLKHRKIPIALWLSYRPAEGLPPAGIMFELTRYVPNAIARRIARPVFETLKMASDTFGDSPDAAISEKLIHILKPTSTLSSIRLRHYIRRLSYARRHAAQASGIMLFDQGFAQAVCSLIVVASDRSTWRIERALQETPSANLFIRLMASDEVLIKRLHIRERRQSRIERVLELDLDTNLRMARAVDTVYDALQRLGRPTISIETHDYSALDRALPLLERKITELYQKLQQNELDRATPGGSLSTTSLCGSSYGQR